MIPLNLTFAEGPKGENEEYMSKNEQEKGKEKKKVAATARGEIRTQDRMGTKLKDIIMLTGPYCKISFTHLRVQTWADIN